VESYGLVEDSAGPGKHRGGMGLRRAIRPIDHSCTFNGALERAVHQPWGIFGGGKGASGRFLLAGPGGQVRRLPTKPNGVVVNADQTIVLESPGAGGYGPVSERSRDAIERDRASGKFSDSYIEKNYGLPRAAE